MIAAAIPSCALGAMGMDHPLVRADPIRFRLDISAWKLHIPFALWLVSATRPKTLVELGTHAGSSYFAFCLAIRQLGLESRAVAVDTWRGDEHAGFYGDEIFDEVRSINQREFDGFSRLLRMTFDDALDHVKDGSVDLLHIDGLHTYEAVRHDFESWRPKMRPDGIVLFHDTAEFGRGFGVHRLFAELSEIYPHFEFHHGHGLGILSMSARPRRTLRLLLRPPGWKQGPLSYFRLRRERHIRRHFHRIAEALAT